MKSDPDGGGWNLRALVGSAYGRRFYQWRHPASGGDDGRARKINRSDYEKKKIRRREREGKKERRESREKLPW